MSQRCSSIKRADISNIVGIWRQGLFIKLNGPVILTHALICFCLHHLVRGCVIFPDKLICLVEWVTAICISQLWGVQVSCCVSSSNWIWPLLGWSHVNGFPEVRRLIVVTDWLGKTKKAQHGDKEYRYFIYFQVMFNQFDISWFWQLLTEYKTISSKGIYCLW